MPSFNKVHLIGNLTRDVQLKYLPSQTAVAEFGMAINRTYTKDGEKREEVTFVDCTAFGKQAEVLNQYVGKGRPLFVEGRLKYDTWEDKQGGGKRSKLSVVVENFQFLGTRDGDGGSDDQTADNYPRNRQTVGAGARGKKPSDAFGDPVPGQNPPADEDIPF